MPSRRSNEPGTARKFLDYARPNETGWTEVIRIDDLNQYYNTTEFTTINGGAWCRNDGLLRNFNVRRLKGRVQNEQGKTVNRIVAIQLCGFKESVVNRAIRGDIRSEIAARKCAILMSGGDIQVDHKIGNIENEPRLWNPATQLVSDFQALCRAANAAKRGHCRTCQDTRRRFDARVLGYAVPVWRGSQQYDGNCVGCYWYDPVEFNAQLTRHLLPEPVAVPDSVPVPAVADQTAPAASAESPSMQTES